jgi:hypothetical protein
MANESKMMVNGGQNGHTLHYSRSVHYNRLGNMEELKKVKREDNS